VSDTEWHTRAAAPTVRWRVGALAYIDLVALEVERSELLERAVAVRGGEGAREGGHVDIGPREARVGELRGLAKLAQEGTLVDA